MYIAPGQGQKTPWEHTFDVNRKPLSLCPILQGLNKIALKSDFINIHFFHVSPNVYSPWEGQTIHWGQNFDDNKKSFSLCPYVASFKMISSKSDFIHIFNDFIHVYSPGQGQKTSWGQTFDVNRQPLSCRPFVASLKQISLNSDFIHIFQCFPHAYSPGVDNPLGKNFWCQQKGLITLPI